MQPKQQRLYSIDVFRAITMFLMIFVNDFDGVEKVPEWIKHAKASEDALGFADTIFPAFLFILGLSIPIALQNRIRRGQTNRQILVYILLRGLALLVMGFFHVNLENYSSSALLPLPVWELIITIAFFLIWIDYPEPVKKATRYVWQAAGIALLVSMAFLYKGEDEHHLLIPMQLQWYGILGLLGWSYLICAPVYLLSDGKVGIQFMAWLFFFSFSIADKAGLLTGLRNVHQYVWIVGSGSMPAFTMAGVFVTVLYQSKLTEGRLNTFWLLTIGFGFVNLVLGFTTRPLGGISKINDTPSWIGLCTGIAILAYVVVILLVDKKHKKDWFRFIIPAGTNTLVCYLIPYLLYSLYEIFHFQFPAFLNESWGGFFRSIIVSLLVIQLAGWLEKKRVRLKL